MAKKLKQEEFNPHLQRAILDVVENQLRDGTPPETRATLARLMADGRSREEAVKLIGCVVSAEIFDVLKNREPYNETLYLAALRALPERLMARRILIFIDSDSPFGLLSDAPG
jgi:hypothetical protein